MLLFDPRYRLLQFLEKDEKENLIKSVESEATALITDITEESTPPPRTGDDTAEPPRKRSKLLQLLGDVVYNEVDSESSVTPSQKASLEVAQYTGDQLITDNPLVWWKHNSRRFPILSKLARTYLPIPATSVPSERAFSIAGHIANAKRACLLPENVNMLVFLAENLDTYAHTKS